MAGERNTNPTKEFKVQANVVQLAYFEQLRIKGTFGNTKGEIVIRLVDRQLARLLKDGELQEVSIEDESGPRARS